jgi:hypothetical protein
MVATERANCQGAVMASVVFDKLWDEAFEREGELINHAGELAHIYGIVSAIEAIQLAKRLQESGRPFFERCEEIYTFEQRRYLERMKRQGRLSDYQVRVIKQLLAKAMKGW